MKKLIPALTLAIVAPLSLATVVAATPAEAAGAYELDGTYITYSGCVGAGRYLQRAGEIRRFYCKYGQYGVHFKGYGLYVQ